MKTYQELETENQVLTEQLKQAEERTQSLVKIIERLTNLGNHLVHRFYTPKK